MIYSFYTPVFFFLMMLPISHDLWSTSQIQFEEATIWIETSHQNRFHFYVELAKTPTQHARGLMYRTTLSENRGMLFLFDTPQKRYFWMKNTYIPLDLLFLDQGGSIVHIYKNASPRSMQIIPSNLPSLAVLEIQGGLSDRLGIRVGDRVVYPFSMRSD